MPAKSTADVPITYRPQLTTQRAGEPEDPPLEGSLFFALPTGDALLFNLEGRASEAAPQPTVSATCRVRVTDRKGRQVVFVSGSILHRSAQKEAGHTEPR